MVAVTETGHFSLANGGPCDRALARLGLASAAPLRRLMRAFLPALVVWVPLAALAWLVPHAGGDHGLSFFEDLATHVRFLVVVPLLLLVEASIGRRTKTVTAQFVEANLVAAADRARYDALLRSSRRAIDSALPELVMAILAGLFVWSAIRRFQSDGVLFWFEVQAAGGAGLSAAGWWYALGSLLPPFLLLRWMWRYFVWCWLLQRISRLDLQVVATHPDHAAGLGFVAFGHAAFAQLAFALSCLVAGGIGTRVLHEGASLADYQWPLAIFVCLSILIGLAPLAVFWRPLRSAKEAGMLAYGTFAARYVQEFHRKWIGTRAGEAPLEASGDAQGLADIGGSFERVYDMRLLPVTLKTAIAFAVCAAAPMLPLLLTVMPLRDLLKLLMQAMI
jgi:hypothetical protein